MYMHTCLYVFICLYYVCLHVASDGSNTENSSDVISQILCDSLRYSYYMV